MYLLPLDQRLPWPPGVVATAKKAIYDGFRAAADGAPVEAGIIADELSGAAILRDAGTRGFAAACALGAVDDPSADIDDAVAHARACGAAHWMTVLRYNPDARRSANLWQAARVRRVCEAARREPGARILCDLVVLATKTQIARGVGAFDRDLLPELTARAISELVEAGVDPWAWVIQGFERRVDYVQVVGAAEGGRHGAGCFIRAAGHRDETTRRLMATGLSVPGVIGLVLSRAAVWEPAAVWMSGRTTRATVVDTVASLFRTWINLPVMERKAS
jgi:myo-inositol catabolism protein IolC